MNTTIDNELVDLLVDVYARKIEPCLPDLFECGIDENDPDAMRDAVEDYAADRIYEGECREFRGAPRPEFRVAAKRIANLYC